MIGIWLTSADERRHTSPSSSTLDRMLKQISPSAISTQPGAIRAGESEPHSTSSPTTTAIVPIATTTQLHR